MYMIKEIYSLFFNCSSCEKPNNNNIKQDYSQSQQVKRNDMQSFELRNSKFLKYFLMCGSQQESQSLIRQKKTVVTVPYQILPSVPVNKTALALHDSKSEESTSEHEAEERSLMTSIGLQMKQLLKW